MNERLAEIASAIDRNLSDNVRTLMREHRISQTGLAHELGLRNLTAMYDRLTGRAPWKAGEVLFLAELFKVSTDKLIE